MFKEERFIEMYKGLKNDNSISTYKNPLKILRSYFNFEMDEEVNLTSDQAEDFVYYLKTCGNYRASSINTMMTVYNEYYEYLVKKGDIERNPFMATKKCSQRKVIEDMKEKYICSVDELKRLSEAFNFEKGSLSKEFKIKRDKAIMSILATSGTRQSILRKVTMDKMVRKGNMIILEIPKTMTKAKIPQRIVIANKCKSIFEDYLEVRDRIGFDTDLIFPTKSGKELNKTDMRDICTKAFKLAGIESKEAVTSPHTLRNSLATIIATREDVSVPVIKTIFNWTPNQNNDLFERYSMKDISAFDEKIAEITNIL